MSVSSRRGGAATVARSPARRRRPPLTVGQILTWADAHRDRTGDWPTSRSGPIAGVPDVTWWSVAEALIHGYRGLPGGDSLARLLARCRGRRNPRGQPPLSIPQILAWADAHHQRHGRWPSAACGVIAGAGELTWRAVNLALRQGHRGLPGGSSLSRLLSQWRGKPLWASKPAMSVEQILSWAEEHRKRTGQWPKVTSGPVGAAPEENWQAINMALRCGNRGLPAGLSLRRLRLQHTQHRNGVISQGRRRRA
jgi:hypothetical protein